MPELERRHSRWYEQVVFNKLFQLALGVVICIYFPFTLRLNELSIDFYLIQVHTPALILSFFAFSIFFLVSYYVRDYPGAANLYYIFSSAVLIYGGLYACLIFLRYDYVRVQLFFSFLFSVFWVFVCIVWATRYQRRKIAVVPFGRVFDCLDIEDKYTNFVVLTGPDFSGRRFDGVVADLHSADIPASWEKFLAECTLSRIPVFHYKQLFESITGRVKVEHLSENIFGVLLPSRRYELIKRILDLAVVLVLLPIWFPVFILVGILVKLDSKGPVLYTQRRMGYRGKYFKIYKFRSMRIDMKGEAYTVEGVDPRITRIGHFIRKFRIDELPQFFNVLKGDMSLIGPRPESDLLAEVYEKDVPFFKYRHVVRPGISGWAQVMQGYAAETEGMKLKLEYDFYYIKHFSLFLDFLIFLKTIKTILTGFGAR